MMQKGIKNASALLGGTAAWKGAKYPMETAEKTEEKKP
jgi:rhodanese-related sulfurtransferase